MDNFDSLFGGNAEFMRNQLDYILTHDPDQYRESLVLLLELAHAYGRCDGVKMAREVVHGR